MGRGKNKAKQTRVARDLKYSEQVFDPAALSAELRKAGDREPAESPSDSETSEHE